MAGQETIIIMLKCHFRIENNKIHRLNTICKFLLRGLEDSDHEKRLNIDTMGGHINVLARVFSTHGQHDLPTIKEDLWMLLTNWWNTARWARREIRVPMEKENLLGDLLANIVREIRNDFGEDRMRQYYTGDILQALIQIAINGNITDPFLRQRVPQKSVLDDLLRYYQQLSTRHGFDNRTYVLLQLLRDKKKRNENSHSDYKVQEYKQCCNDCEVQASFNGYIAFRGLNIDPQFFDDYERLFQIKYFPN